MLCCLQKACHMTDTNSAKIGYHYRVTLTITVILANAGTHSSASAESFVSKSPYNDKHPKCRESKVNSVVPSTYNARFRMGPRLREDDKKKMKETGRQETVRERVECFVVSRKLATRQTRTALKLVTITEPHSSSPSFSRTREPIHPRTPRVLLAKVLTTTNIPNAERAR